MRSFSAWRKATIVDLDESCPCGCEVVDDKLWRCVGVVLLQTLAALGL